ncbi:hypothetical protein A4A49_28266 [Nicotiana attenuata]|uniref:Uncharacterized protein n=1 Tax=Nicotiana attenuata TaxID=49451 RepID=A0A1J6KFN4_NICAT|nr:hypothetical protein A4A49_28266 [Nicotiana attenuata]
MEIHLNQINQTKRSKLLLTFRRASGELATKSAGLKHKQAHCESTNGQQVSGEKPAAPTATVVQQVDVEKRAGQVHSTRKSGHVYDASDKSVTSHLEKVAAQNSKEEGWTMVRQNTSPEDGKGVDINLRLKTWADQVEEDEDDDFSDFNCIEDEECDDESLLSVGSPTTPSTRISPSSGGKSNLNSNAPVFVPKIASGDTANVQIQHANQTAVITPTKEPQISDHDRQLIDALETPKLNNLVQSAISKVLAHGQKIQGNHLSKIVQLQEPIGIVATTHEHMQQCDQRLLQSSAPSKMVEHGQKTSGKNKNAQFKASTIKPNGMVVKRHEPLCMVAQRLANQQLEANLRVDIFEKGEEEDLLDFEEGRPPSSIC